MKRRAKGLLQKDEAVLDCRQLGGHAECRLPNSCGRSRHGPAGVAILAKRQRRNASPLRDRSEAIESWLARSFPALNPIFASVVADPRLGVEAQRCAEWWEEQSMTEHAGEFEGKQALVTGAGKGIGRATARLLARRGAKVLAVSRSTSPRCRLKTEIGGRSFPVDLAD